MTGYTVSVNLSARQFRNPALLTLVQGILSDTGLEARWLELEITESMLMENIEQATGILQALKALGLNVSIDDFGTGHSSLATLSKLPVNKLKVDRSFIHNLPANAHDRAITTAVIALAQKLGMTVVAEGVENAAQRDFLLLHHCSFQQGYEFGAPVAFADLPRSIARLQGHLDRPPGSAEIRH
jgi:EAL domain-containing protein (putative c-di-GMP-specific phosphodiesterase class I)